MDWESFDALEAGDSSSALDLLNGAKTQCQESIYREMIKEGV